MIEDQHKESMMIFNTGDGYSVYIDDPELKGQIDRDKAEQLCKTYELYRKAHDHATAFELAYGIEVEGLPF